MSTTLTTSVPIETIQTTSGSQESSTEISSFMIIVVVVLVVLFVSIIIVALWFLFGKSSTPPAPEPIIIIPTLATGQTLNQGDKLPSSSGNYYLTVQSDGNLILYSKNNNGEPDKSVWAACPSIGVGTVCTGINWGTAPYRLTNQTDGNVVLYDSTGKAGWATNTMGLTNNSILFVTNTGIVQLTDRNTGQFLWWSAQPPIM